LVQLTFYLSYPRILYICHNNEFPNEVYGVTDNNINDASHRWLSNEITCLLSYITLFIK